MILTNFNSLDSYNKSDLLFRKWLVNLLTGNFSYLQYQNELFIEWVQVISYVNLPFDTGVEINKFFFLFHGHGNI